MNTAPYKLHTNLLDLSNRLSGTMPTNARNLREILGYKNDILFEDYLNKYKRQDIASRIVDAYPDAVWSQKPSILGNDTLEASYSKFVSNYNLYPTLNRLDKVAGIGRYAILLIGVSDGLELSQPLVSTSVKVTYLQSYCEQSAVIESKDNNLYSERYGLPLLYKIRIDSKPILVHYTRVIHIAENLLLDRIYGKPTLEPVYDRLEDLEKVIGGSSEMFYLNGRGGLNVAFEDNEEDVQSSTFDNIVSSLKSYIYGTKRFLITYRFNVKPLSFEVPNPTENFNALLDLIAGTVRIPKRILIGSERGNLASSQDENNWLSRVAERRDNYCEPFILRPLINKLMVIGVLPKVDTYELLWNPLVALSEKDQTSIMKTKMDMLALYTKNPDIAGILPIEELLKKLEL